MVRIFHELGLETGFAETDIAATEAQVGRAGLERRLTRENAHSLPLIIKSPWFVDSLPQALDEKWLTIDVAIVPMRRLEHAAQSRVDTSDRYRVLGGDPLRAPGGLWKTDDPAMQLSILAQQFYQIVEALQAHEVPIVFLGFPRFVIEFDHFDRTVGTYLRRRFGISRRRLRLAHAAHCKPELVTVK